MAANLAADNLAPDVHQQLDDIRELLRRGLTYGQQQDHKRAIACFNQALHRHNHLFGEAFFNSDLDYSIHIAIRQTLAQILYRRACTSCQIQRYNEAIADFTALITQGDKLPWISSRLTEIYVHRGNAYRRIADYRLALADLNIAVERAPYSAQTLSCRGLVQLDSENYSAAIQDFSATLAEHPTFAHAYLWRGFAQLRQGAPAEALPDLDRAIAAIPNCPQAYNHRGLAHFQTGELRSAIADFSQAIRLNGTFAEAYNNRGNLKQLLGDAAGAKLDYDRAVELDPYLAEIYLNRAANQANLDAQSPDNDLNVLSTSYDKTADLQLNSAAFYRHRAQVRQQREQWQAAIDDYSQAIALQPTATAYYERSRLHHQQGNEASAFDDIERAIALAPDHGPAYLVRAQLHLKRNDLSAALRDLNTAEQISPTPQPEMYSLRCLLHFCQNRQQDALAAFEQLIQIIEHTQTGHTA